MSYTMNPQYQKSVLDAYSTLAQAVATDGYIDFDNISVLTGCSIKYVAGTPGIVIANPGLYLVTVDATAAASEAEASATGADDAAAATSTDVAITIQNNGELIPGATTAATSTGEDDKANLSLTTVIKVRPSCCAIDNTARLSVVNTGIPANYTDASITIVKLC